MEKAEQPKDTEWQSPVDMPGKEDERVRLACLIASQINTLISSQSLIPERAGNDYVMRKIRAGDFLILVQRRSVLFHEIIKACKKNKTEAKIKTNGAQFKNKLRFRVVSCKIIKISFFIRFGIVNLCFSYC